MQLYFHKGICDICYSSVKYKSTFTQVDHKDTLSIITLLNCSIKIIIYLKKSLHYCDGGGPSLGKKSLYLTD